MLAEKVSDERQVHASLALVGYTLPVPLTPWRLLVPEAVGEGSHNSGMAICTQDLAMTTDRGRTIVERNRARGMLEAPCAMMRIWNQPWVSTRTAALLILVD